MQRVHGSQILFNSNCSKTPKAGIRLVQGSHIIVKRLYPEPHAFILQNDDQRIVFVIPYLDEYSLIGTTDVEFEGDANSCPHYPSRKRLI